MLIIISNVSSLVHSSQDRVCPYSLEINQNSAFPLYVHAWFVLHIVLKLWNPRETYFIIILNSFSLLFKTKAKLEVDICCAKQNPLFLGKVEFS